MKEECDKKPDENQADKNREQDDVHENGFAEPEKPGLKTAPPPPALCGQYLIQILSAPPDRLKPLVKNPANKERLPRLLHPRSRPTNPRPDGSGRPFISLTELGVKPGMDSTDRAVSSRHGSRAPPGVPEPEPEPDPHSEWCSDDGPPRNWSTVKKSFKCGLEPGFDHRINATGGLIQYKGPRLGQGANESVVGLTVATVGWLDLA